MSKLISLVSPKRWNPISFFRVTGETDKYLLLSAISASKMKNIHSLVIFRAKTLKDMSPPSPTHIFSSC